MPGPSNVDSLSIKGVRSTWNGSTAYVGTDPAYRLNRLNLSAWYRADRGVRTAGGALAVDNDPVAQWDDYSPNQRHQLQATTAARPTFKTNIRNGQPVVRFDGVDDFLEATGFATGAAKTLFLVGISSVTAGRFVSLNTVQQSSPFATNGGNLAFATNSGGGLQTYGSRLTWFHATCVISSLSVANLYYKGVFVATIDPNDMYSTGTLMRLGNVAAQPTAFLTGDIAEIIAYDIALSDARRQQVEAYLAARYAIT